MKKSVKIVILIVVVIVLAFGGYYLYSEYKSNRRLEKKISNASEDYFEKYMSTNDSSSTYVVTLDMLMNANEEGEDYDLKGLEKCSRQTTLSKITIDYNDGKPKKIEVELNC